MGRGAWRWLQGRMRTLEAARAACADEVLRLTRRNAELRRAAASLAEKARSAEHRLYREQKAWEEEGRRSEDEIAIQRAVAGEIGRKYVEEVRKHEVTKCERDTLDTELRNERKVRCRLAAEVQELRRKVSQSVTGPSQEGREVSEAAADPEPPVQLPDDPEPEPVPVPRETRELDPDDAPLGCVAKPWGGSCEPCCFDRGDDCPKDRCLSFKRPDGCGAYFARREQEVQP